MAWTNLVTDGRTDAGNDNTRRPKLASGKNSYIEYEFETVDAHAGHLVSASMCKHFDLDNLQYKTAAPMVQCDGVVRILGLH